jgi:hypothetical protein
MGKYQDFVGISPRQRAFASGSLTFFKYYRNKVKRKRLSDQFLYIEGGKPETTQSQGLVA